MVLVMGRVCLKQDEVRHGQVAAPLGGPQIISGPEVDLQGSLG